MFGPLACALLLLAADEAPKTPETPPPSLKKGEVLIRKKGFSRIYLYQTGPIPKYELRKKLRQYRSDNHSDVDPIEIVVVKEKAKSNDKSFDEDSFVFALQIDTKNGVYHFVRSGYFVLHQNKVFVWKDTGMVLGTLVGHRIAHHRSDKTLTTDEFQIELPRGYRVWLSKKSLEEKAELRDPPELPKSKDQEAEEAPGKPDESEKQ